MDVDCSNIAQADQTTACNLFVASISAWAAQSAANAEASGATGCRSQTKVDQSAEMDFNIDINADETSSAYADHVAQLVLTVQQAICGDLPICIDGQRRRRWCCEVQYIGVVIVQVGRRRLSETADGRAARLGVNKTEDVENFSSLTSTATTTAVTAALASSSNLGNAALIVASVALTALSSTVDLIVPSSTVLDGASDASSAVRGALSATDSLVSSVASAIGVSETIFTTTAPDIVYASPPPPSATPSPPPSTAPSPPPSASPSPPSASSSPLSASPSPPLLATPSAQLGGSSSDDNSTTITVLMIIIVILLIIIIVGLIIRQRTAHMGRPAVKYAPPAAAPATAGRIDVNAIEESSATSANAEDYYGGNYTPREKALSAQAIALANSQRDLSRSTSHTSPTRVSQQSTRDLQASEGFALRERI